MQNDTIQDDAQKVFDTVKNGGVAIFPVTVGYAIVGHREQAIRKIYTAKQRSFSKPCGMFGNWELFNEVSEVGNREREIVRTITQDYNLPFSVVAPFRTEHPIFQKLDRFVIENSTKAGTLDLLMNAGPLHDAIAAQSHERQLAVFGSSANKSLTGSKFQLQDVEAPVRDVADLTIDYGLCQYHNPQGRGSTIIDLSNYRTIRVGCVYDEICSIVKRHFDIDFKAIMAGD